MTFEEFIKESHEDLDRFAKIWRTNNVMRPDSWPMEMEPGDWFEQFLAFTTAPVLFVEKEKDCPKSPTITS